MSRGVKRSNSWCCFSSTAPQANRVSPLDTDLEHPRVAVDNFFVRGQGDGASDNETTKHKLERKLSSGTCSTRTTIGDTESHSGLSSLGSSTDDSSDSSDDSSDSERDEMKTEITEGGLSKVAIDLDHPFAPYYEGLDEEDIPNMLLSDTRLRGAGFFMPERGERSTLRGLDSQMSTYTDCESSLYREDTPVPGKRPGNLIHHLAKRRTCPKLRKGSNVLGRHVPSDLETMSEQDRAGTPALSTHRSVSHDPFSSQTTLSTARTLPADDIDSLASSNDNLSAIGEQSESSSCSTSSTLTSSSSSDDEEESSAVPKHLSTSYNLSNNFLKDILQENASKDKLGNSLPLQRSDTAGSDKLSTNTEAAGKPKIPPKPPRRKMNAFSSIPERPPQSADPLSKPRTSPRSIDVLPPVPRTADIFSRKSSDSLFKDKPIPPPRKSKEKPNPSYLDSIIKDTPTGANGYFNEAFVAQQNFVHAPHPGFPGAVNDGKGSPSPRRQNYEMTWQSRSRIARSPRAQSGKINHSSFSRHNYNTTDVESRPKAARPRRPSTAAQTFGNHQKQAAVSSEDATDGLDEESHPEGPDFSKFTTIIVI